MIFYCQICGIEISENVERLEDTSFLDFEYEKDCIPKGYFAVFEKVDRKEFLECQNGDYLLNLEDLKNIKDHKISSRLSGCCGLGNFGINKICVNGHEIGTEHSDCNLPRFFLIESKIAFNLE